ncbi:MAG: hypothetical protein P9F19_18045 [Candidatus Contendobacter sp.]|nr:hypothetical protein [Candidatus Contendobacter sp.]MDG4559268.1 hypothetical protein [Candidatus Contendobacter sp.]
MPTQPDALFASDYVVCATLRKIPDVFNVELLWERVRGGQEGLFLMDALKRHPRAPRGRQRKETRYSHVIVRIPERDYVRDERLEDGFGRRTLLRELHRLHEQELGRYLAEHATIRYRVEADTTLRAGEVQFLFGRAIYLPDENETPIFRIQAAAEGAGEWRDVGPVYPGQRLTLLNGDRRASSFAVTAWPFPGGESVLLMLQPGTPALVDMVAEPPGGLVLAEDDAGSLTARDRRGRGLRLRVIAADAEPGTAGKPAPVHAPPQSRSAPAPVARAAEPAPTPELDLDTADPTCPLIDPWGRRQPKLGLPTELAEPAKPRAPLDPPPGNAAKSATPAPVSPALDQHTWVPQRPAVQMQVLGIALQRLSTYAAAGISDWRIGFNRAGGLTPSSHPDAAAWLRVDSADRLFGEVVGLETPLEVPGTWQPFPELRLDLRSAPQSMTTHYLGWVRLPTPLSMPVPRERAVSFGRGSEADIAPRLLADPRSLRWDGNSAKTSGVNAEYLGLSRRHLRLQARRDDWLVQLESQNMSVYRLTPSGELLDVLSPGINTTATAKPGELLVAGGYVLALGAVG